MRTVLTPSPPCEDGRSCAWKAVDGATNQHATHSQTMPMPYQTVWTHKSRVRHGDACESHAEAITQSRRTACSSPSNGNRGTGNLPEVIGLPFVQSKPVWTNQDAPFSVECFPVPVITTQGEELEMHAQRAYLVSADQRMETVLRWCWACIHQTSSPQVAIGLQICQGLLLAGPHG